MLVYVRIFLALTLLLTFIHADDFERLNPRLTKEMKESQEHAKLCASPAVAKEKFDDTFRYGCFCGKGYPDIKHASGKKYTKLNRSETEELIAQYYEIEPYDSIDEVCMKHDICYLYRGGEDQICNDAIYNNLREIEDAFFQVRLKKKNYKKEEQCRILASDMGSFFKTIFGVSDNASMFHIGMLMVTTPITLASKGVQKTAHGMNRDSSYPLKGEKCLVNELNVSKIK
jgi:hypothetical protein